MQGFKPRDQRDNRSKKQSKQKKANLGFANGGMIRGPGTGTSDDIEAEMPAGSYIMPADSTKQIGPESLSEIGSPMDVRVSNGEYQMPPEQVHALGAQVLEQIKDETHTPAAQGFQPDVNRNGEQFFNQGGLIEGPDELKRRAAAANRPALPAPEARPALPPPQAQPQAAHNPGTQNTAFNNHGRGDYTAADQARARARADGASWQAERAAQDAKFQKASTAQPQAKPRGFASSAASKGRKALNAGGRLAPVLAAADAITPSFEQDSTARYAERFGVSEPTGDGSFGDVAKFSALRAGGFASDLGNTLTFGQAGRLYRDKQREAEEGESPYTEKAPNAAAVAGGLAGGKALGYVGKGLDTAASLATRGRYNKRTAEKALGLMGAAGGGAAAHNYTSNLMSDSQQEETGSTAAMPANLTAPALPIEQQAAAQEAGQTVTEQPQNLRNNIIQDGNSFSAAGPIGPGYTVNGQPSSGTNIIPQQSAQNRQAVSDLMARTPEFGAGNAAGFQPQQQQQGRGGANFTVVKDSSIQERAERAALNAARTAHRGAQHGQLTANQLNNLRGLAGDIRSDNTSRDNNAANNAANLQATGMREQGQDRRTGAALAIDQQRLQGEQTERGFRVQEAQQIQDLREQHMAAETPEQRSAIAEQLRFLSGQGGTGNPKDNYITLGGGQVWDEQAQSMVNQPQQLFDIASQQIVSAGSQLPPLAQNPQAQAIIADGKKSREQKALELRQMGYSIDLSKFQ